MAVNQGTNKTKFGDKEVIKTDNTTKQNKIQRQNYQTTTTKII